MPSTPSHESTFNIVMETQALNGDLQQVLRDRDDYGDRITAIAALIRRVKEQDTAVTALIMALAATGLRHL